MERCRIVVTNRVHDEVIARLAHAHDVIANESDCPWSADEVVARAHDAHAIMAFMPDRITADMLDACPKIRIIAGALKGYDNFDRNACTERGVWLTIVPDLLTDPTAELTVGMMIALARNLLPGDRYVRSGQFAGWRPRLYGTGLAGSTIGVVGMGAVGRAVTQRLTGFGARLVYTDQRGLSAVEEKELGVQQLPMNDLLKVSDYIVLAVHLTTDTLHLLNANTIGQMKPGAFLINPGRGSLVDESAVADALQSNRLGGYAADVFEMEDWARHDRPRSIDTRLLEAADRTVFSPHLGSAVRQARLDIEMSAAANILACLAGKQPPDAVNRPVTTVESENATEQQNA